MFPTLSVCIPCVEKHVKYLDGCMNSIYNQTVLPDEVIVSISSCVVETIDTVSRILTKYNNRLKFIIIYTEEKKYAGENRNIALKKAGSEIISFIDADDYMYEERIFLIKTIFKEFKGIKCVLHYFTENIIPPSSFSSFSSSTLDGTDCDGQNNILDDSDWDSQKYDQKYVKPYIFLEELHFGHANFHKSIFNDNKYLYSDKPRGQDIEFINNLLPKYHSRILIYQQPLTYYISNRSTFY